MNLDPISSEWKTTTSSFDHVYILGCELARGEYGTTFLDMLRANSGGAKVYATPGEVVLQFNSKDEPIYTLPKGWAK